MRRWIALVGFLALAITACAEDGGGGGGDGGGNEELIVQVASYDVAVGGPQRLIVGLLMPDQRFVSYGNVEIEFFYLGTKAGKGTAQSGPTATGEFLSIPGEGHSEETDGPIAAPASRGRGVYAASVSFDRAGFWSAQVTAAVENEGELTGNSVFEVLKKNAVPAPGDTAPRTDNLTIDSKDAPLQAVDSRAANGGKIPDEELHQMTIKESIARGEPALVVFATPVYCVSRFCGPITDMIQDLADRYGDRANFIHVEIWRNYQQQAVNKGAADWLLVNKDLSEPWVYLIDADGKITARWDNVATAEEIEPYLEELPPL